MYRYCRIRWIFEAAICQNTVMQEFGNSEKMRIWTSQQESNKCLFYEHKYTCSSSHEFMPKDKFRHPQNQHDRCGMILMLAKTSDDIPFVAWG